MGAFGPTHVACPGMKVSGFYSKNPHSEVIIAHETDLGLYKLLLFEHSNKHYDEYIAKLYLR